VPIAFGRRLPRIGRAVEVAAIDDIEAARSERFGETGDAQRLGAHRCTAITGADIGRRADQ